ncbi:PAS/PAC sensor signal transduction histidine kinase [Solidesulfovibrio carbinoliphilus subsp. oakridgensis]|uniref:histidine kinase n=1 Tax=Solidesulfovibrio carbinoliphilus subsp. oakridgensis TaxID=694327 RepID=G7Q9M5_9BACT|nr:histidine kinase dimerization/phospho-acceptor domain-containing protein [Solidesulfovibrio carbinoliphilus]EHJ48665.1 PAS/PAC sensor signal transduction histidine kinase [Solidesulfovibrio carbinoliphilus subsp. oakridgensis]
MKLEEKIIDYLVFETGRGHRLQTCIVSFLLIVGIALLDNFTATNFSLFTLYLIPILYVVSRNEVFLGYVLTFSCSAISEFLDLVPGEPAEPMVIAWNIFRRTAMLAIIVFFVDMTIKFMRRYHTIVEDQDQFVCRYRPDGTLSFCNNTYVETHGIDRHAMSGYTVYGNLPEEGREQVRQALREISVDRPSFTVEHKIVLADGTLQWQHWNHRAIFNKRNVLTEVQAVGRDVTERKKYQELKEQFDKIMLHDIKGPLTGIIGLSESLLKDPDSTERQRDCLDSIKDAGYRILYMVGSTLDLYKMENGFYSLDKEEVDLFQLVQASVQNYRPHAEAKNMAIDVCLGNKKVCHPLEYKISGDKHLAFSLLENLLKNAIEATPCDENIRILFSSTSKQLCICNKGEVPCEIRDKFFDKFVTSKKLNGTGLGTYSAALIARMHGWGIRLDASVPGQTTICVAFEETA